MNWRDEGGIWQHGVRSWRYLLLALVGSLLFGAVMPIAVVWYLAPPLADFPTWALALFGVAALLMLGAMGIAGRWALRANALLQLVPANEGRVCPKCEIAVAPDELSEQITCPKCHKEYTERDLQAHWRRFGVSPIQRSRWMTDDKFIEDGAIQSAIRVRAVRRAAIGQAFIMLLIWGGFVGLNTVILSGPISMFQNWVPFILLGVAMILAGCGWRAVEPERRFCTACQYEREESAGPVCPECGSEWDEPGATTAGRIVQRRGPLIGAGLALGIMVAMLVTSLAGANLSARLTPTNVFINRIAASQDVRSMIDWQNLGSRTLTPEQERRLFEMLLAKRDRDELTIYDGLWLNDRYVNNAIPSDLLDEFYRGMISFELLAPQRVKVGETIDVKVRTIDRFTTVGTPFPTTIVGGFYVGDGPEPRERPLIALPGLLLGDERHVGGAPVAEHYGQHGPRVSIVAEDPGTLRVRLELWVVIIDQVEGTSFSAKWNQDGTPVIPVKHEWVERVVIEHEIEVVDGP